MLRGGCFLLSFLIFITIHCKKHRLAVNECQLIVWLLDRFSVEFNVKIREILHWFRSCRPIIRITCSSLNFDLRYLKSDALPRNFCIFELSSISGSVIIFGIFYHLFQFWICFFCKFNNLFGIYLIKNCSIVQHSIPKKSHLACKLRILLVKT